MKSTNLIAAIELISRMYNAEVAFIEFEDGSGNKFNYRLVGDTKVRFVDLGFVMKTAQLFHSR